LSFLLIVTDVIATIEDVAKQHAKEGMSQLALGEFAQECAENSAGQHGHKGKHAEKVFLPIVFTANVASFAFPTNSQEMEKMWDISSLDDDKVAAFNTLLEARLK
jgi:hypothetical protein